jgi:phage gp16-like protein
VPALRVNIHHAAGQVDTEPVPGAEHRRPCKEAAMITNKQKALIHVAKTKTGLSDDEYRDLLSSFGAQSSVDLSPDDFEAVMRHFKTIGFQSSSKYRRSPQSKQRLMAKIAAIRAELGLTEAYIDGMVHRMFKGADNLPIASHRWLNAGQLHKLVAALTYHQRRQKRG